MEIQVINLQKKVALDSRRLVLIVEEILKREKIKDANLSFVFVTDRKIRSLNKRFLNEDHATDILSFALNSSPGKVTKKAARAALLQGEIVISVDTAVRNAGIYQTSLHQEISLYMIHGILHLLGYDDHTERDTALMRKKEQELLAFLALPVVGVEDEGPFIP